MSEKSRENNRSDFSKEFYGSSTLGDRGQLVIPPEARADMGFNPGDKLLIMRHPHLPGLMVFNLDGVREFLDEFQRNITRFEVDKEEDKQL